MPPTLTLTAFAEALPLAQPFVISRGSKTHAHVLRVDVSDGQHTGRGEAVPYARFGEDMAGCLAQLDSVRDKLSQDTRPVGLHHWLPAGAARNALDCALWDLLAKRSGTPVWQLLDLPAPAPFTTAYTISLGSPAAMANAAKQAQDKPVLKLKLDGDDFLAKVTAVHQARPDATLLLDANEAWTLDQLKTALPALAALKVALIEQPLPEGQDDGLRELTPSVSLCADESCHTAADIPALKTRYQMVNIKLDKTGGLTGAVAAVKAAQAAGLQIMLGCMVASSLAMAPIALLAGLADYVDLDGPLLLAKDRDGGFAADGAVMLQPAEGFWGN